MLKRQSSSERCPSSVAATYRYDLSDRRYIPKSAHFGGPIVMVASILNSLRAIEARAYVVRSFVKLREMPVLPSCFPRSSALFDVAANQWQRFLIN